MVADPGFVRLDLATRTTAGVALATGLLLFIERGSGNAQMVVLVGAITAWIAALPVNDLTLSDRRITTLLIAIPAIVGIALGSAVAGKPLREDVVFLIVLFVSVYIRRFGVRYFALGVVAVFAYFFALFAGTKIDELPALVAAIFVGTASAFAARFLIAPKHAQGSLSSVMEAVLAQAHIVLEGARDSERMAEAERYEHAVRGIARMNETMLTVQEQGVVAGAFDDLALRCELATENLVVATLGADPNPDYRAAAERELYEALDEVRRAATSRATDPEVSSPQRDAMLKEEEHVGAEVRYHLRPATRQALQVTAAAAVAIAFGEYVSPQRWYWAVITAFIVFSGTTSAGEILSRAWAGFLGTTIGVVAGSLVGILVQRDVALESLLLFLCMLFAAYFLRSGLGVAWFFVTLLLVMLYRLLGRFTEEILVVRVLEILVGAAAGGIAAAALLPTSTRRVFRADVLAAAQALGDALDLFASATASTIEVQAAARRFDVAVRRLRARVDPLHSGPTFAGSSEFARHLLWDVELCAYYSRNAARGPRDDEATLAAAVRAATTATDALIAAIEADERWPLDGTPVPKRAAPRFVEPSASRYVEQLRDVLGTLVPQPTL